MNDTLDIPFFKSSQIWFEILFKSIQVGKGPYASEVSGIIKIGQTMTMVLGVKDDENKFDMMVRFYTMCIRVFDKMVALYTM